MKAICLFCIFSVVAVTGCHRAKDRAEPVTVTISADTITHDEEPLMDQLSKAEALTKLLDHKVLVDTLLGAITHQDRVKLISRLADGWDEKEQKYIYRDSTYLFKLGWYRDPMSGDNQSILYDGGKTIRFKDYQVLCPDPAHLEVYGYNLDNTLDSPVIIEVCGRRFLYASVMHFCMGIGCGTNLTLIYDIANKHPTFIENYRIDYSGYYVSDLDGDSIPDLLVTSQADSTDEKFAAETTILSLYQYKYKLGRFTRQPGPPLYRLFGFTAHTFYPNVYSQLSTQ
ncbi:MAG: hypothetical protein JSS76_05635 [Bacteroidetes bacterium]|nr:hypothetical protein [Bacteroidota bacterium]